MMEEYERKLNSLMFEKKCLFLLLMISRGGGFESVYTLIQLFGTLGFDYDLNDCLIKLIQDNFIIRYKIGEIEQCRITDVGNSHLENIVGMKNELDPLLNYTTNKKLLKKLIS